MDLAKKITALLTPHLESGTPPSGMPPSGTPPIAKFFVVDLKVSTSKVLTKITILIDTDTGIQIDECAEISRKLGHDLEEQNVMPNAYNLEISSPGIDMPLKLERQYDKNMGRTLRVILKDGTEKVGQLLAVSSSDEPNLKGINLLEEPKKKRSAKEKKAEEINEKLFIPFEQIKEAMVVISFK